MRILHHLSNRHRQLFGIQKSEVSPHIVVDSDICFGVVIVDVQLDLVEKSLNGIRNRSIVP